jgi:hypothetical protein
MSKKLHILRCQSYKYLGSTVKGDNSTEESSKELTAAVKKLIMAITKFLKAN